MRTILIVALLLASGIATGAGSQRFGNRLITTGDSVGALVEVAGKPDRVVQLENRLGAAMGERWEYYRDGHTIIVVVQGGRISSIEQV